MYPADLITPHTRGTIARKIQDGKPWTGTRAGFRIEIQHERQLNFSRNPIRWRIKLPAGWREGHSPSVWDAIEELRAAAAPGRSLAS